MDNKEIARVLEEIAELMEIKGENPFKVRAYHNGARVIEGLPENAAELVEKGTLRQIKGIGEGLSATIAELVEKGDSAQHKELKKSLPAGLLDILGIPGLGPKRAKALYDQLSIKSVSELEKACQNNKLVSLDGFGEKSQAKILEAIKHHNKTAGYFLISQAVEDSGKFVTYLKKKQGVLKIEVAGSVRRAKEIVHDVDILVATAKHRAVHEAFTSYPEVVQILAEGATKSSVILKSGIQADLRTVSAKEFPCALYYFTGSKEHNVATRTIAKKIGIKINEYGLFRGSRLLPCKDEADIFKKIGLRYIPPELRENSGEIEAAKKGSLPDLLEAKDIKGVFHVHTTESDGTASLENMVRTAVRLGYEYVGISDHSKTAVYANGLSEERVKRQQGAMDRLQKKFKQIRIFRGIESDILGDGSLDYSDKILRSFDFVIGSIHSRFKMTEKEMTNRITRAMEHPQMTIWGHPTGRLLLGRAGYQVDFDALFETARKHGVAIEINANPQRLDLDWRLLRSAKAKGVRFAIDPDAHSMEGLSDTIFGVGIARKGWLEQSDVLNTMSAAEMEKFLNKRKAS